MEVRHSQFAIKLLPSFTDMAFLMPVVLLFGRMEGIAGLLGDGDTGWHIRTGEWILNHRAVPFHDLFSYSKAGAPWYAWEWLSDVWFALLNRVGGLSAVALFAMLAITLTMALLFRLARRHASAPVAAAVTMLAAVASSIHWLARPHLFTLLLVVVFLGVLEGVREGRTRFAGISWMVWLPVLMVIWTNLHGGFVAGIVLVGGYAAAGLLQLALAPDGSRSAAMRTSAYRYLGTTAACGAATLVNPYFWNLHVHVFSYLRDPFQQNHIMEFLSLDFHHPAAIFFEAMLMAGAVAAVWYVRQGRLAEPMLFVVWAHVALRSSRHVPILMLVAAPMVAQAADRGLACLAETGVAGWVRRAAGRFNRMAAEASETDSIGRWHLVSAAGIALVALLVYAPNAPAKFRAEFDARRFPAGAVTALGATSGARIFTFDQWGDYLIYRLYPHTRVFVDGRSDFYGDDFEQKTADVLNVASGWERTLARFHVDTILMPPTSPLAGALKESSRWRVVYDDGIALVFRPNTAGAPQPVSAALCGGGSRDREVTKTQASDRLITELKPKT